MVSQTFQDLKLREDDGGGNSRKLTSAQKKSLKLFKNCQRNYIRIDSTRTKEKVYTFYVCARNSKMTLSTMLGTSEGK